ncbi:MAG TPA: hypothetical protein VH458_08705, partial [Vicinamibacterales bacterium]
MRHQIGSKAIDMRRQDSSAGDGPMNELGYNMPDRNSRTATRHRGPRLRARRPALADVEIDGCLTCPIESLVVHGAGILAFALD